MKKIYTLIVIMTIFLSFAAFAQTNQATINKPSRGVVKSDTGIGLNVRKAPNTQSEIVGGFSDGTTVDILEVANAEWYKVSGIDDDGKRVIGYSFALYINVTEFKGEQISPDDAAKNFWFTILSVDPTKR